MLKTMQSGWEIFTLSPAVYIVVNVKVISNQFHAIPTLVESEPFKRKTRLSE